MHWIGKGAILWCTVLRFAQIVAVEFHVHSQLHPIVFVFCVQYWRTFFFFFIDYCIGL